MTSTFSHIPSTTDSITLSVFLLQFETRAVSNAPSGWSPLLSYRPPPAGDWVLHRQRNVSLTEESIAVISKILFIQRLLRNFQIANFYEETCPQLQPRMSQTSREGRKECEADGIPQLSKVERCVGSKSPRREESC